MPANSKRKPKAPQGPTGGAVDPRLLDLLVCPVTQTPLVYDAKAGELISRRAGLAYPIRDGIPVMLPEEARRIDPTEKSKKE